MAFNTTSKPSGVFGPTTNVFTPPPPPAPVDSSTLDPGAQPLAPGAQPRGATPVAAPYTPGTRKNADGSTTTIFADGSSRTTFGPPDTATFKDREGNPIDSAALLANSLPDKGGVYHVNSEAEQNALYTASLIRDPSAETAIARTHIGFPQADGSNRPLTNQEANPQSGPDLFDATTLQGWKDVGTASVAAVGPVAGATIGTIIAPGSGTAIGYGLGKKAQDWAVPTLQKSVSDQTNGGLGGLTPDQQKAAAAAGGGGALNTKALQDYTQGLIADSKNFKPAVAPTVTAPGQVTPTLLDAPTSDFKSGLVAGAVDPIAKIDYGTVNAPGKVTAGQVAIPGGVSAGTVTAERIGGATAAPVDDITLEGTRGRAAQYDALGMLKGAADGTAPSQAQALLQKGIDQSVGSAYGLASSLQGRNAGLAMYTGIVAARDAAAKSSADMAALRADEMAKARGAYSTAATQMGDQDLKAFASNQSKDLSLSVENLRAEIEVQKANQAAALSAGQSNVANDLTAKIETMRSQLKAAEGNRDASLTADMANQTAALDASKATAANQTAAAIQDSANELKRLEGNRDAALRAADANQAADLNIKINELNAKKDMLLEYQKSLFQAAQDHAAQLLDAQKATGQFQVQTQSNNDTQDYRLKELGLTGLIGQLNAEQAAAKLAADKVAADRSAKASDDAFWGTLATDLAKAYTAYQSSGGKLTKEEWTKQQGTTGANGSPIID